MYWMLRLPESGVDAVLISIVLIGFRPSPQSASSWSALRKRSRSAWLVATACAIIVRCTFWLVRKYPGRSSVARREGRLSVRSASLSRASAMMDALMLLCSVG